ncbi:hypothetical protein J422_04600 [Methanocaldococcus villosus KIN24-T80]|uniref:Uncharacterized protein n=1 Tax=Methanocaldococcus villosus KIN24-T80 TaxID=1069083 RepID=N6VQ77_9EURY|nr:hypothetical protein [Methanocaldococcus villosus]ENN96035.1 hypothetical protein J422_04600 [Methanocaldococcus villosus KIN24-T80]
MNNQNKTENSATIPIRIDKNTLEIMDTLIKHKVFKSRNQLVNKIIKDFYYRLYCETIALELINKAVDELKSKNIKISRKDLKNAITSILPILVLDISMYYDYLDTLTLVKKIKFQTELLSKLGPLLKKYVEENEGNLEEEDLKEIYDMVLKLLTIVLEIKLGELGDENSNKRKVYEIINPKIKNALKKLEKPKS